MPHRPEQRTRWRELAAKDFDDLYHAAHDEQRLKSPDIGMKVDCSMSSQGGYDRATASIRFGLIKRGLPPKVYEILEAVIIGDRMFASIAEQIGATEGQVGRWFAAGLDDICDILRIPRPRQPKEDRIVFYAGQRVKCVNPDGANATPPLVVGAFYTVAEVVEMTTREGRKIAGLRLVETVPAAKVPGFFASRFAPRSLGDVGADERARGNLPSLPPVRRRSSV